MLVQSYLTTLYEYLNGRNGLERVDYVYEYQYEDGDPIFRYDNAKHRPDLGFRQHKHEAGGAIVEAPLPDIEEIMAEVTRHFS